MSKVGVRETKVRVDRDVQGGGKRDESEDGQGCKEEREVRKGNKDISLSIPKPKRDRDSPLFSLFGVR